MLKKIDQLCESEVALESAAFDLLDDISEQLRDLVDELAEEHARQRQPDSAAGIVVSSDDVLQAAQDLRRVMLTGAAANPLIKEMAERFLTEEE